MRYEERYVDHEELKVDDALENVLENDLINVDVKDSSRVGVGGGGGLVEKNGMSVRIRIR